MVPIIATAVAALAALLHVYIFVMESIQWTQPRVWRRFGVADQAAADVTKPMAYNQGFYNLFLAIAVFVGIAFVIGGSIAIGATLVITGTASMAAAALVLALSSPDKIAAALKQGVVPALGIVVLAIGLAL